MIAEEEVSRAIRQFFFEKIEEINQCEAYTVDGSEQLLRVFRQGKTPQTDYAFFVVSTCLKLAQPKVVSDLEELVNLSKSRRRSRVNLQNTCDDFVRSVVSLTPKTLSCFEFEYHIESKAHVFDTSPDVTPPESANYVSGVMLFDDWDRLFIIGDFNMDFYAMHWSTTA